MFKWLIDKIPWVFSGIGNILFAKKFDNSKNDTYIHNVTSIKIENNIPLMISEKSSVDNGFFIVDRFYSIFEEHGIIRQQIPSFLDDNFNITLNDVKNPNDIVPKITDEILNWVSEIFKIKLSWFYELDDFMYNSYEVYKHEYAFLNLLLQMVKNCECKNEIDIYFFKNFDDLSIDNCRNKRVIIVIRNKIKKLFNKKIYCYSLITNNLDWGYWKTRQSIKLLICISNTFVNNFSYSLACFNIHGYDITEEECDILDGRKTVPLEIISNKRRVTWYPEDYCLIQANEQEDEMDCNFTNSLKIIEKNCLEEISKIKGY